jgi:hypothetical protein
MAVDLKGVLADQVRSDAFVDIGFDRARAEKGFAEPDKTFVGVDLDPKQVGKLVEPKRLNSCDVHLHTFSSASTRNRRLLLYYCMSWLSMAVRSRDEWHSPAW